MIHRIFFLLLAAIGALLWSGDACAQAVLQGTVLSSEGPIPGAHVAHDPSGRVAVTDAAGRFTFPALAPGRAALRATAVGFRPGSWQGQLSPNETTTCTLYLEPDALSLEGVVVSATRSEVPRHLAPVMVNTIGTKLFETTQSVSLAEGLQWSPGLRVENNCANCGFTQVRMNGLEGPYTQILINSRPVFSALAGVYGLEMLPPAMIDRVEVVRGGGSALYGGNAIAGTINIITRDPVATEAEAMLHQAFTNLEAPDRTAALRGAAVDKDIQKGLSYFATHRRRGAWDANGDGITELTRLRSLSGGVDGFWKPSADTRITAGMWGIQEHRRGGSNLDRPPHQSEVAEQLDHRITGARLSAEWQSADRRHTASVYTSAQYTERDSYYGAGGRILLPGDTPTPEDLLAINAYGFSTDLALVSGAQYAFAWSECTLLTTGAEWQHNHVRDHMPGYNRTVDQRVHTLGSYAQVSISPLKGLTLLPGARFDVVRIRGSYRFFDEPFGASQTLPVFMPRMAALYRPGEGWQLRSSWALGYRAPQAFDEDLHVETAGGTARFISIASDLQPETSRTWNASITRTSSGNDPQWSITAEAFHTLLSNPFVVEDVRLTPGGVLEAQKRNGDAAVVQGINLEVLAAKGSRWLWQWGATVLRARYTEPLEVWLPEGNLSETTPAVTTQNMLRTPDAWAYTTLRYAPKGPWTFSTSAVYTGSMIVPHLLDGETGFTALVRTPNFFEHNLKAAYTMPARSGSRWELFAGVQNLWNSFQRDFVMGPERDAGYMYGPLRPRTVYAGARLRWTK